jgi:N-acetylmuramoyl-L-alanine amidase
MKIVPFAALSSMMALLAGCATVPPPADLHIDRSLTARGQSERIKYVIIHYTVSNLPNSIKILTQREVSAHYLLTDTDKPFFYALVDEARQSNHAGVSNWKIYSQLNSASIGIEIVNPGFTESPQGRVWYPYKQAQIDQLILLLKDIVKRYNISPDNILGHNDIAPQRKQDPGPLFPWKQLADAGLITWPEPSRVAGRLAGYQQQLPDVLWFQLKLAQHGYAVPQTGQFDQATRNVLTVFQSKYRQARFDGVPDAETAAILDVLTSPLPALPASAGAARLPAPVAQPATAPAPAAPIIVTPTPGTPLTLTPSPLPPGSATQPPVGTQQPMPATPQPVVTPQQMPSTQPSVVGPQQLPATPQPAATPQPVAPATEPVESD